MLVREISRLLISLALIGLAGYLFYEGVRCEAKEMAIVLTDTASFIIGGNVVYWLKGPNGQPIKIKTARRRK